MNPSSSGQSSEGVNLNAVSGLESKLLSFKRIKSNSSKDAFSVMANTQPDLPAIYVNGDAIAPDDIMAEAQHHPSDTADNAMQEAARALVVKKLLLQEAGRLKIEAAPQIDNEGRLETQDDALIHALLEREVTPPVAQESNCKRYYDQHPNKFSSDTIYEARHILLAAQADQKETRSAQRVQAESLIARLLQAPDDFTALAATHSDCPSREQGGNLGQLTRGSTVLEFERALESIPVGEIARQPIESRFGFHVVKLDRCIPGEVLPFDAVRDRIAAWLETSSWSRAIAQYVAILAGKAKITGYSLSAAESSLVQ